MHNQLTRILTQFDSAQSRIHALADNLTDAQWSERTDTTQWSVGECVAHLNRTGEVYLPLFTKALEEAKTHDGPAPRRYRRDALGWMLSLFMGPVPRLGRRRIGAVATTPDFMPEGNEPKARLIDEFDRLQREQTGFVREADGLPIHRVWVTSPFDARVRYNLYSAFIIVARHQLRHVVQAERLLG